MFSHPSETADPLRASARGLTFDLIQRSLSPARHLEHREEPFPWHEVQRPHHSEGRNPQSPNGCCVFYLGHAAGSTNRPLHHLRGSRQISWELSSFSFIKVSDPGLKHRLSVGLRVWRISGSGVCKKSVVLHAYCAHSALPRPQVGSAPRRSQRRTCTSRPVVHLLELGAECWHTFYNSKAGREKTRRMPWDVTVCFRTKPQAKIRSLHTLNLKLLQEYMPLFFVCGACSSLNEL